MLAIVPVTQFTHVSSLPEAWKFLGITHQVLLPVSLSPPLCISLPVSPFRDTGLMDFGG